MMVGSSAGCTLVGFLLPIVASWLPVVASWPAPVVDYRAVLYTDNATAIALAAAALRTWMAANDPDYPLYHLAPPEGHANDPNGVTWDAARGLYHRFYQYDRTYDESCMHGNYTDCDRFSRNGTLNPAARAWGQTTSRDLVHWEEWPAIVGDSEWDWRAVYSGNCALDDRGDPVCVYTGGREAPCDTGVCATSRDWIHWEKRGCMLTAPSPKSQTNHDSALVRLRDGTWVVVVGGCTYNGSNVPNGTCMGNAQLWRSDDLSTFRYWKPLGAAEGPGTYWELPYLLGFDEHGTALPNDAIEDASTTALLFGEGGNKYFFGSLADDVSFSRAWAEPKETDAFPPYYSFNPHATDVQSDGTTRRLMFGWILVFGPTSRVSAAAEAGRVPPWDGAHSLCRAVTADAGAGALVQTPCPETRALRGIRAGALANKRLADGVFVGLSNVGDALNVVASFDVGNADFVGLSVRVLDDFSCDVVWNVSAATLTAGVDPPWPAVYPPAPTDPVELEVFVDRSIVEVYFFGAALTSRCALPASLHDAVPSEIASVRAFAKGGTATLAQLEAWTMGSMWV